LPALLIHITSECILGNAIPPIKTVLTVLRRIFVLVMALGLTVFPISAFFASLFASLMNYVGDAGALCLCPALPFLGYASLLLQIFIGPVFILEKPGIWRGIKRSLALARLGFIAVAGLMTLLYFILMALGGAFSVLLIIAISLIGPTSSSPLIDALGIMAIEVLMIFLIPILPITLTLAYYDARIRLEGLDLTLNLYDQPVSLSALPSPDLALTQGGIWIDIKNIGYLVLMYAILYGLPMLVSVGINALFVPGSGGF